MDYTRQYSRWHTESPDHYAAMKVFFANLLAPHIESVSRVGRVLDVGCGMGFAMLALMEMGFSDVAGIDIDKGQVESCRRQGLQVVCDESRGFLERAPNTYDLVVCLDVLEHIAVAEQVTFLRAIFDALQPGGKLVLTAPNANSILAARWRYDDWTHTSSFTEHSLDFLLFNSGFADFDITSSEFFASPAYRRLLSRDILNISVWASISHWGLLKFVRLWQRMVMIGELGWEQGRAVPLSLNLMAVARKPL